MKLIKTKDYLLLIDEEVEIKPKDKFLADNKYIVTCNKLVSKSFINGNFYISKSAKIIAYYPLKEAKELDLPLLPSFEDNFDLKQEIIRWYHSKSGTTLIHDPFLNEIVNKVQSKQFSLEDMKKAFQAGTQSGYQFCDLEHYYIEQELQLPNEEFPDEDEEFEEFIQSLSTQQFPKEFIPEYRYYYQSSKEFYSDAGFVECSKEQYESIKVEIPTCPLKAEIKTTTNSEGREEIVGAYKY